MNPTVLVVMGVSGTGKTTIALALAAEFGWEFGEGDDLHPQSNLDKMAAGDPLTDEDRWPWLELVSERIRDWLDAGKSGVITCSALRRSYRDRLAAPGVVFVYLYGSTDLIAERMGHRTGHFMPTSLLQSQLDTLEEPTADEAFVRVDLGGTPEQEAARAMQALRAYGVPER